MKKLILALALAVSLTSCSTDETTPDYNQFQVEKLAKVNDVISIEVISNYDVVETEIFNVTETEFTSPLVSSSKGITKIGYKCTDKGLYKFSVYPMTEIENPTTTIILKNETTNKVIDITTINQCLKGYDFRLTVHTK